MNINFSRVPFIYDINPQHLWIPFAAAATAQVVKEVLPKIFPPQEDHLPLAGLRFGIRNSLRMLLPPPSDDRRFLTVNIPENFVFAVFVASIIQLKASTSFGLISQHPVHVICSLTSIVMCSASLAASARILSALALTSLSYKCSSPFVVHFLENSFRFIETHEMKNQQKQGPFSNWYATNGATAAGIEFKIDYKGIPWKYHENLIFSQFIDPISFEPIRFPVTASNKKGGPDLHFERATILTWLTKHEKDPITHLPMYVNELKENGEMRKIIEDEMKYLCLDLS